MTNLLWLNGNPPVSDSLRIFWKIIVEANGDNLRIVKQLSLWGQEQASQRWHRYLWKVVPLQVEIGNVDQSGAVTESHRDQDKISVEDGYIFFKGGYLKILDGGLVHDVQEWGLELDPATAASEAIRRVLTANPTVGIIRDYLKSVLENSDNLSPRFIINEDDQYYAGYNVRLEADIALKNLDRQYTHPIFYYRQDPAQTALGVVSLEIKRTADQHEPNWSISNKAYEPEPYHLAELHLVVVNQETEENVSTFSFLADAVPLPLFDSGSDPKHLFTKHGGIFYVGFAPGAQNTLQGYVRRIVFDPNASCIGCA